MGYEMTRPAQKLLGMGSVASSFLLMLFTLAVPYVNHFGDEENNYTFYTKWNGYWREGNMTFFFRSRDLFNFPASASILIGLGLLIAILGSVYFFWLTYQNKSCYITRERPGPIGGVIMYVGIIFYFIGSFIYERWATGAPRPQYGWPLDNNFLVETVRLSPTFWFGLVLGFIVFAFASMNIVYFFDTKDKRPVK
ncbi:MAG: hypothetical protein FK730_10155 [Asgard group archaeon]|nr:hypothetical protein [Asgard group archaeon]